MRFSTRRESVCILLARSLAKLTRASEKQIGGQEYLRYVIHWRGDQGTHSASEYYALWSKSDENVSAVL